ncbi:unnamed protein product [Cylicocyclus nassatus]|uniref:Uncharacterized protein n=1 Tax=Cylicocyclus nassatus TaxID=53992 RepID=A0AA36M1C5_CYLNA|nr:unnamed protein product [Cylicocyclus nassatus]
MDGEEDTEENEYGNGNERRMLIWLREEVADLLKKTSGSGASQVWSLLCVSKTEENFVLLSTLPQSHLPIFGGALVAQSPLSPAEEVAFEMKTSVSVRQKESTSRR